MQELPHLYTVTANAELQGEVRLESPRLNPLVSAPPEEFGGPGDLWSPETLLVAAVADCFILGFRAVARASHVPWSSLTCCAEGTLARIERVTRFTEITLHVELLVPAGVDEASARRALERAEQTCLITNSLTATTHLNAQITPLA